MDGELDCPNCGSGDAYEDYDHRLHCFDCGEINDAFVIRYNRDGE